MRNGLYASEDVLESKPDVPEVKEDTTAPTATESDESNRQGVEGERIIL